MAISAMAIVGLLAMGCSEKEVPPSETAARDASVAPHANVAPPASAQYVSMPKGWRDLHLGMSEEGAKKVIYEYRRNVTAKWTQSPATNLMTVRLDLGKVDRVAVDRKRFHEWSIEDLDEGTKRLLAWFDEGKLVAIQVEGTTTLDGFLRKATEAYGSAPRNSRVEFFDERTMTRESRSVAFWYGDDVTATVWASNYIPTLLLWSNAAMRQYATRYQTLLDAPALAASKEDQARENGTKF